MRFMVGFCISAENREIVEEILERIGEGYKISDADVQNLGPEKKEDNYAPKLTVIERDSGWCLQIDGEDQVVGILSESPQEEHKTRRDAAFHISSSNTLVEHQERVKKFFILLLQLTLGDYEYFESFDEVESKCE